MDSLVPQNIQEQLKERLSSVTGWELVVSGVVLLSSCKVFGFLKNYFLYYQNKKLIRKKQEALRGIKANWSHQALTQIADSDSQRITKLSFEDLRSKLHSGELTAVKVLHAYQYQAVQQDKKINFICEPVIEAQQIAEQLDRLSEEERKSKILFGIPISVKEIHFLKGYDTTSGCAAYIHQPAKENSALIQVLLEQGAVPFIRTNIPQTCMAIESDNPIYGSTCNPHNTERTCGGSSGGEGAAIASCGSILGVGSDIGGSIRIPSAWSGCYGLKPTAGRLSFYSDHGVDYNERIIQATSGPLGRDVASLTETLRCLSLPSAHSADPYVPPIPLNTAELESKQPLRIGYFHEMDILKSSISSHRAVDQTVAALRSAGHELVGWSPPDCEWALSVAYVKDVFADGLESFMDSVKNDVHATPIAETVLLGTLPIWLKRVLANYLLIPFFPNVLRQYLNSACGAGSVAKLWKLEDEIRSYRKQVVDELKAKQFDVIICPAMPIPAVRIGTTKDLICCMGYMGYLNVLNFPAGVVPITRVTSEDVKQDMKQFPTDHMWYKAMKKSLNGSEGLPVAIQVFSLPYHEERCLRVMKQIESLIGYDVVKERTTLQGDNDPTA